MLTGQCQCRPGFGGRTCNDCPDNTHGNPLIGCKPCLCNPEGTQVCNKLTGSCLCRPGITGPRCDSCTRGHCDSFPICKMCPSCFFSLDSQRQALSLALEKFTAKFPPGPGGSGDLGKFEPRIRALEARLNFIWNSVTLPPSSARQIDDALSQLDKLRDQVDKVSNGLSTLAQKTDLSKELDKLQDLLDNLNGDYNVKKETLKNTINPSNAEAFTTIKNAYDGSKDAANKAEASKKTVKESADNREDTLDIQEKQYPNNTRALKKLNDSMASGPDLTPVAKKVCGSVRSKPCTPLTCEDVDLCPPEGSLRCERGSTCVGALPIGKMANSNVKDVKDRLEYLSNNITEAAEKLQDTQDSANDMRESTKNLSNKIREAGRNLEDNLKEAHHVVKELKDFLSDPSSNLTHIQNVSDLILKTKLPLSPASLKKKLDELKNLATNLPDSTSILNKSAPQLDAARKLLQEAQDTRNAAQGVKDDVDELVAGFDSVEDSLADMEDRLQNNLDSIDKLHKTLIKNKDQLRPAEKTLDDVTDMINPIKPQLDELKDLLQNGTEQAEDAQETADKAEDEAAAADQEVSSVQQEFDRLKDKAAAGQPPSEVGPGAEQLAKLKKDVGTLANTTDSMLNDLEGKADSLKLLQDEILQKSTKLEGLEAKLKDLVEQLQKKAHDLSVCQG